MAQGQTAVLATLPNLKQKNSSQMLRVQLGNMPPHSIAFLRAYCNQQLDVEDLSYCFRLPMSYIPGYMGNVSKISDDKMDIEYI